VSAKNIICLWYEGGAEEAARFYAKTFPDTALGAVHRAGRRADRGFLGHGYTVHRPQRWPAVQAQ
jgi:predicted 3-demethylubiquinone-9 3-methyltransferase (glyoxalase superfamily)